jgi:hypothetical protein
MKWGVMKQSLIESFNQIPSENLDKITKLFHRCNRSLFLGEISSEIGWSLERTQMMVDVLVEKNVLRGATHDELRVLGVPTDTNVYVLVGRASLTLASW